MTDKRATQRIDSLDSLRGLAALVVVFYHFSLLLPAFSDQFEAIRPLRILLAGRAAVLLFFLLSGFVLYLSLQRHSNKSWLVFAIRRMVRLYPPVMVAVLVAAILYSVSVIRPFPDLGEWLTRFSWNESLGAKLVGGHLLLLDGDRYHSLDNPIWSLGVEIRLSLLFPLLAIVIRHKPILALIGSMVISAVARHALVSGHQILPVDPIVTLQFLDLFALGGLMAREAPTIIRLARSVPFVPILVAGLTALCVRGRLEMYSTYIGAMLLLTASFAYPHLNDLYRSRPLVWLGKRSYSLYLVHVPLLLTTVYGLYDLLPIAVVLLVAFGVSLVGAELFWLGVERPSQRLSRHVGQRIAAAGC